MEDELKQTVFWSTSKQNKEEALSKLVAHHITAVLDKVGEPKLGDFEIKPDSYDDVIKAIDWYKKRLATLRQQYKGGSRE